MSQHGCNGCTNRWGGLNTAHCGACHKTFSTVAAFDMHRTGSHAKGTRSCLPPAGAGLVLGDRAYRCWVRKAPDYLRSGNLSHEQEAAV
jgi:hypothetical protein